LFSASRPHTRSLPFTALLNGRRAATKHEADGAIHRAGPEEQERQEGIGSGRSGHDTESS
ncbi:unnamed protein product, partial [Tilletia controversa]